MKEYYVDEHEKSLLPDCKSATLVWHDEFDGTELDRSKWDYRLSMMGKNWPAWTEDGVVLDGKSNAVFKIYEKDGRAVSAQLQTGYNFMDEPMEEADYLVTGDYLQWPIGRLKENKFTHKYGYYECRCKLQQTDCWWSAFWLQSPIIGASLNPADSGSEVDIMECIALDSISGHNVFTGGYGKDMKHRVVGGGAIDTSAWHRFGLLWDENGYTFYVDGKEDGNINEYVSHIPQFILISTEVRGYRTPECKPREDACEQIGKDEFIVDYVRVFDIEK